MTQHSRFRMSFPSIIIYALILSFFSEIVRSLTPQHLFLSQKFLKRTPPEQPTTKEIIFYIHGWQRDPNGFEKNFEQTQSNPAFLENLLGQGYIFHELLWLGKAHSTEVRQVQSRIWDNDEIIDDLLKQVDSVRKKHPDTSFRFVGHSLGNQVMLRLTERLLKEYPKTQNNWPQRLAMLEPAFLKRRIGGANINMRNVCIDMLKNFEHTGMAIEIYRSSFITRTPFIGYSNQQLVRNLPYPSVDLNHRWFNWIQFSRTHCDVKNFYFSALTNPPQTICGGPMQHPAASLRETFQNYGQHYEQIVHGKHEGLFHRCDKPLIPSKCPVLRFFGLRTEAQPSSPQDTQRPVSKTPKTSKNPITFSQPHLRRRSPPLSPTSKGRL